MLDHGLFYDECEAAGLPRPKSISGDVPTFPRKLTPDETAILEKVVSAHGKPAGSAERQDLAAALTTENRAAYEELRQTRLAEQRRKRYREETDHLILDALAEADPKTLAVVLKISEDKIKAWLATRDKIRKEIT